MGTEKKRVVFLFSENVYFSPPVVPKKNFVLSVICMTDRYRKKLDE